MIKVECISGPLMGETWTVEAGRTYKIGRSPDADIEITGDRTVSSRNTVLAVKDGVPYVGACKVHDDESNGTWVNDSYLSEKVDDTEQEKGWIPLYNEDVISIGWKGRSAKFRVISDKKLSMEQIRKTLPKEMGKSQLSRPQNLLAQAKEVNPDRIRRQVREAMERVYRENDLTAAEEAGFFDEERKRINTVDEKRIRFKEAELPDSSKIEEQILKEIKARNDAFDDLEEILDRQVRLKEFVPEASERMRDGQKKKTMQERPVPIHAAVSKNYKENFQFSKLDQIGKGGFSNVYLIRDSRDGELLVMKSLDVVKDMTASQEAKYLREADIGEKLDHPNLVKTYDIRKHNGNYYMLMEYCDGGSIKDLMENAGGYLDLEEATDYFLQVLDGLDYLHNAVLEQPDQNGVMQKINGVVHRDIKPANMLVKKVSGKKMVKLGDFGLAKSYELAGFSGVTGGEAGGSRRYCSKRQYTGNFRYVEPQDDVFSAAASYYEMITGKCVRDCSKYPSLDVAIFEGSLVPVCRANPHIPKALADVIDSVLKEESWPSDSHFTTAKELKEKIKIALDIR